MRAHQKYAKNIVNFDENVNNSQTNRNFEILTPDSDSAGEKLAGMQIRQKSETKIFSSFRGSSGGYPRRNMRNENDIRAEEGRIYNVARSEHLKSRKNSTRGGKCRDLLRKIAGLAEKRAKTSKNAEKRVRM